VSGRRAPVTGSRKIIEGWKQMGQIRGGKSPPGLRRNRGELRGTSLKKKQRENGGLISGERGGVGEIGFLLHRRAGESGTPNLQKRLSRTLEK